MIFGIGIDIIEVSRIHRQVSSGTDSFIKKIFTDREIEYCESKISNKAQNYAARFAVKEAFFKALGTGWRDGLYWKDIEVEHTAPGKPNLNLSGRSKQLVEQNKIVQIHVSLSHLKELAVAVVILEK